MRRLPLSKQGAGAGEDPVSDSPLPSPVEVGPEVPDCGSSGRPGPQVTVPGARRCRSWSRGSWNGCTLEEPTGKRHVGLVGVGGDGEDSAIQTLQGFSVFARQHDTEWAGAAPRPETALWCEVWPCRMLTGDRP